MTNSSENPFHRRFWLGQVDARIPALLRIALGLLLCADLADRLRDFHAFYTDGGLVPRQSPWPLVLLHWSAFDLPVGDTTILAIFLSGFVLAGAFALGYRTRPVGVLLWIFVVSLGRRNHYIEDGGDRVIQVLLFWSMFADTGARFSLDIRRGRRPPRTVVPAAPVRFLQLQVALIYLVTALAKSGPTWRGGDAVALAITSRDWGRGLGPALAAHPAICAALTYATLLIETTFAPLVLCPWKTQLTRAIAIVGGVALHAGIFLTMRVGVFSQVMPVSYILFVSPAAIDWAARRLRRREAATVDPPPAAAPAESPPDPRRLDRIVLGCLALQFAFMLCEQAAQAFSFKLPAAIAWELGAVGQHQNWRMFSPDAPTVDVLWKAPGELADGRKVELTDTVVPELNRRDGFRYSRWHRLRATLITSPEDLTRAIGRYLCRRWNGEASGAKLVRFTLTAHLQPRRAVGPPEDAVFLRQECLPATPAIP